MQDIKQCPVCGGNSLAPHLVCTDRLVTQKQFTLNRCEQCGMVITSPRPLSEELGAYYQSEDYVSHSDTQKGLFFKLYHSVRRHMLRSKYRHVARATKAIQSSRQQSILDYGCGTGYFLQTMQQQGWHTTGIEIDPGARAFAKLKFGLETIAPEAMSHLDDHSFDAITLWHVMEHVEELDTLLDELRRLLKPGGSLLIALPNHRSFDAQRYGADWAAYDVPRHLWHFSPDTFARMMTNHGWELCATTTMPFDGFYISMMSEAARHRVSKPIAYLWGAFIGLLGWLVSMTHKPASSSLIYTLRTT